ncbi:hypothetical protein RI367_000587 [Sorochytrium milnesiophthora]
MSLITGSASERRLRRGLAEEEDAAVLKLGEEFRYAPCLTVSEVYHWLADRKANKMAEEDPSGSARDPLEVERELTTTFTKTLSYAEQFNQFKTPASTIEIRKLIEQDPLQLEQFEVAQVANFLTDSVDEIKSLVPSLNRVNDGRLQQLLDRIMQAKKFAT